jgi:restriction endonuclease
MAPTAPPRDKEVTGEPKETFDANLKLVREGIAKTKTVSLLEGLPHQLYEREALAKERKEQTTVELHGYPFYAEDRKVGDKEAKTLSTACTSAAAFERFEIPKPCGGFHPDWCIVFRGDGNEEVYRVLVCFGCHEARLYGPSTDVYTDLTEPAFKILQDTLKPHQKRRPKPVPSAPPSEEKSPPQIIPLPGF